MHATDIEVELEIPGGWLILTLLVDDDGEPCGACHVERADGDEPYRPVSDEDAARLYREHADAVRDEYYRTVNLWAVIDAEDRATQRAESGYCQ